MEALVSKLNVLVLIIDKILFISINLTWGFTECFRYSVTRVTTVLWQMCGPAGSSYMF